MHIPTSFKVDNKQSLIQIMQENAFATIITTDENNLPIATHLPFLIKQQGEKIKLQAHIAKVNPQWKHLDNNAQVLLIFQGPHCYVSPSWYKNIGVPTWNYVTVHAYGTAKLFKQTTQLRELIETLTDKYEEYQQKPWKPANNYPDKMLNLIVGFEICVQELQGKVKIGQNKSKEDLLGVVNGLTRPLEKVSITSQQGQNQAIAELIKNHIESKE